MPACDARDPWPAPAFLRNASRLQAAVANTLYAAWRRSAALVVPVHEPKFHWASHLIQSTLGSSTSPYLVFSDGDQNVSFSLYLTNCRRSVASVRAFDSFEAVVMTTDTPRVGGIIATKKMAGLRHVFSQTSARYAIALDCEAEVQSHVDVMPLIRRWERDRTIVGWNFSPRYFPFPSMIANAAGSRSAPARRSAWRQDFCLSTLGL